VNAVPDASSVQDDIKADDDARTPVNGETTASTAFSEVEDVYRAIHERSDPTDLEGMTEGQLADYLAWELHEYGGAPDDDA